MLLRNQRGMRRGFVLAGLGVTLSLLFSPLIQRALAASGSDDFNRANSTNLGSQWTERAGDFQIYSNTLRNANTSADIVASFTGGPYTDVAATVQMQKTANIGTTTIGVRWGGYSGGVPSQGYGAEVLGDGTVKLWRIDDWTVLGSYQIPSCEPPRHRGLDSDRSNRHNIA